MTRDELNLHNARVIHCRSCMVAWLFATGERTPFYAAPSCTRPGLRAQALRLRRLNDVARRRHRIPPVDRREVDRHWRYRTGPSALRLLCAMEGAL